MNKKRDLTRRKTVNQERISKLIQMGTGIVKGMTTAQLSLQNAPKELSMHCGAVEKIINTRTKENVRIEVKDLILTFLSKFNLLPSNFATLCVDGWIVFSPTKPNKIDSWVEYLGTTQFQKKLPKIIQVVANCYKQFPKMFKGMESKFLKTNYHLPKQVTIEKSALKVLCQQETQKNVKNQMKKLYRGLSFFFKARFNLINGTKKNRLRMTFVLNLQNAKGSQDAIKWENTLNQLIKNRNLYAKRNDIKPSSSYKNSNTTTNTNINTNPNINTITLKTFQVSQSLQKLKSSQKLQSPQELPSLPYNNNFTSNPNYLFKTINNRNRNYPNTKMLLIPRSSSINKTNNLINSDTPFFLNNSQQRPQFQLKNNCFSVKMRKIEKLKNDSEKLSEEDLKFEIVNLLVHLKNISNHQK
ncbi:hypothetical protein M0812_08461 [Anaeramoeba flamelloides]|uniref:Uncharacterized protein n=1 Tax=Anaeramoeba flamelloides TaxID=1746091 RepID=A0AAV7ZZC2_9EUKA|nr:hypothetical protein M0812_08461 [Anaeramoeba flamelloides]